MSQSNIAIELHIATASVLLEALLRGLPLRLHEGRDAPESYALYTHGWHRAQVIEAVKTAMLAWPA